MKFMNWWKKPQTWELQHIHNSLKKNFGEKPEDQKNDILLLWIKILEFFFCKCSSYN